MRSQFATAKLVENELDTNLRSQIATSNLSENEQDADWISHFATSNSVKKGFRKLPYAFTRNGIAMLSSVLRSKTAIEVNKRIMRAFTAIPDLVNNNTLMMQRILKYREISFIQLSQRNHDRFLIIDDVVYILGASVKDMGVGLCAITQMLTPPEAILQLLK